MAKNVILISYDGVRKGRILELLNGGQLPALNAILTNGSTMDITNQPFLKKNGIYIPVNYNDIVVEDTIFLSQAVTDSGHARILAGRVSPYANMCVPSTELQKIDYMCGNNFNTVPAGLTIFEAISSNSNMLVGVSSSRRADTRAFDSQKGYAVLQGFTENIWAYGLLKYITGHGFFSTTFESAIPALDFFFDSSKTDQYVQGDAYWTAYTTAGSYLASIELRAAKVAQKAAEFITTSAPSANGFFLFVHFCEPDLFGHLYGEGSQEYKTAITKCDEGLGIIAQKLKDLGIYNDTLIMVTTDHGATLNSAPGTFEQRLRRKVLVELGPLHGDVNADNHITAMFTSRTFGIATTEMTNIEPLILEYLGLSGSLSITSSLEGTSIYVNSKQTGTAGQTPLSINLPVGRYEVYAVKGASQFTTTIDITKGAVTALDIQMPITTPTPVTQFSITVDSIPAGAQIESDPVALMRARRENMIETLMRQMRTVRDRGR